MDDEEIQRLKFERDSLEKTSQELLNTIKKYKGSRTEISIKARELLADRLRQLNEKKRLKEDSMNEIIFRTEKMNVALDKIKIDHKKKIEEMKNIEDMKISYIREKKKLRNQKIKMALDEASIENKVNKLKTREKRLSENKKKLTFNNTTNIRTSSKTKKKKRVKKKKKKKTKKG